MENPRVDTRDIHADEVCKNLLPLIIANGGVDKIRGIGVGAPNGNYYTGKMCIRDRAICFHHLPFNYRMQR